MLESGLQVQIEREAEITLHPFVRYFRGFETVPPVRRLFGDRTEQVLQELKVEFFSSRFGYMGTSDNDGHLLVNSNHLRNSDFRTLYLDVVHELCHVKQFQDGKQLFSRRVSYVDAPTEVEAYAVTVEEGRRIGMKNAELVQYLKVDWVEAKDHRRLARRLGLIGRPARRAHRSARSPKR